MKLPMRPLFIVLTFALAQPLHGQWHGSYLSPSLRPDAMRQQARPPVPSPPRSSGRLILGGALGAVTGLGVALLAYTTFDRQHLCLASDCDSKLGTGLVAATAGTTLMIPLGVHLADSRRGSFLRDLLFSAGVAGLGWGGAAVAGDGRWLILIPPAQIAAAVLSERATAH